MRVVVDEGTGPLAVLLHGQPGGAGDFTSVLTALRGRGLRVVTVDRPGYDGRPQSATSYTGNATALHRLVDRLAPGEQIRLLGLSWGGGVALAYGLAHPERLARTVLASSIGAPTSVDGVDRFLNRRPVQSLAQRALPRLAGLLEATSGSHLTPAERAMARSGALQMARSGGWRAFRVEQRVVVRDTGPLWDRLVPATYPVTVIQGGHDGYVPAAAGRALAHRLGARYLEVDAGHLLHLEVPALLAAELLR